VIHTLKSINEIQILYCFKFANNKECLAKISFFLFFFFPFLYFEIELSYKLKLCEICNEFKSLRHVCLNQKWCKFCKLSVDTLHECFIKKGEIIDHEFNVYDIIDYEMMINIAYSLFDYLTQNSFSMFR
jgi:hypothetical protein